MYEGIIDALMKLFALMIVRSKANTNVEHAHKSVKNYLRVRYNPQLSRKYFLRFEEYYNLFSSPSSEEREKRISLLYHNSCREINKEFNFETKVNLLISLLKFSVREKSIAKDSLKFLSGLADTLRIDEKTYNELQAFVIHGPQEVEDKSLIRIVKGNNDDLIKDVKYFINPNQLVEISFLWLSQPNILLVRYFGERNLYINGHKMEQNTVYIFPPGSMVKTSRIHPVYQSDIMASYIQKEGQARIVYTADNVEYKFNKTQTGLHQFNFRETSGHFVGILGGSGVGKTTLINVLNGSLTPTTGNIRINGLDLHKDKEKLEGIIGYVPQDDLLIEELTVYQNLYYNAKLCFGNLNKEEIKKKVEDLLLDFDLIEARDLIVGSPLKKVLSGGQRKRINIALEVMREPLVLLADEPTSGLSSMDTEKVVSLLKRHCLRGGLVIANIHQPSSDIYKLFDRVIVMDKGGRVVYSGNPLDAISYFKKQANYINPAETECPTCGNVKSDQPLRIIEQRMVSPTGRFMRQRKISPQRWFKLYQKKVEPQIKHDIKTKRHEEEIPEKAFKTPNRIEQFKTFFSRDIKSKLTNTQYLLIAALEAPLLALIFAFFAKTKINGEYIFQFNSNLPSYFFMSVVVALFVGMSISAEELFKDRLLLKREAFLNLSRSAYLSAKVSIVFAISAIQMFIYVIIANNILEIKGMSFYFWIILFSTACFANILALNLSAGLKSIVAIYILIPLMLIPQLLFSGVIVDFQNMNSRGNPSYTPAISDLTAARWAYEAMAVEQYKNNDFQKQVFDQKLDKESVAFDLYYRIPEIENIIYTIEQGLKNDDKIKKGYYILLQNEMNYLSPRETDYSFITQALSLKDIIKIKSDLKKITAKLQSNYNTKSDIYRESVALRNKQIGDEAQIKEKQNAYINEKLDETLTGRYLKNRFVYYKNHIIQKDNPVYHVTPSRIGRSHFYAPYKEVLGKRIDVLVYNLVIIWIMIVFLALTLYTDLLRRILTYFENLRLARMTRERLRREERSNKGSEREKRK